MSKYRPPKTPAPGATTPRARADDEQRIAKLLARAGIASRREVERMIAEGRVARNGVVIDTPATILASLDGVTVDGNPVAAPADARLFLYHKPSGLLVTERDPAGRPTIYDRLPQDLPRLVPVGRLDLNTEGLLLLTTDGELKRQLELPATGVERAYRARAYGPVTQEQLEELIHGIEIEGVRYGSINANLERRTGANVWIEMILTEGKNREVRRVLEFLGLRVSRLIRTRYGPFLLGDLAPGDIGEVRAHDVAAFRKDPKRILQPERIRGPRPDQRPTAEPEAPAAARPARTPRALPKPQPVRITRAVANTSDRAAFAEPRREGIVVAKAPKVKRFYDAKPKAGSPAPAAATRAPARTPDGRPARVFNPELGRNVRAKTPRATGGAGAAPARPGASRPNAVRPTTARAGADGATASRPTGARPTGDRPTPRPAKPRTPRTRK
ncbi:pseudouridine synthase [Sphingomonas sp. PAMC 26621]|uniref:pseudouridine synthase n=1 Tax=Sphingomonas sp. PAMC 26621 TaxID=1112213 RepID=UPI000289182B|nr:pseudouridine synthase [Sphingomonas sp. PAMC 26621]